MPDQFDIAVVGATGVVGEAMLEILRERKFPVGKIYALASERSIGKTVSFGRRELEVENLADFDFSKVQIGLFSAGGSISQEYAPKAVAAGCVVVDNTSHFRYDDDIPLVVPEVNPDAIAGYTTRGIIANPNCSTIQMVVALKPIYDAVGIELAVGAASAAGGGIVYLSPGVFHVKSSVDVDESNVILMGAGVGTTFLYRHTDCLTNRTVILGSSSENITGVGLMNLTVSTETAVASGKNGVRVGSTGYTASAFIRDVSIEDFNNGGAGYGLELYNANECVFTNMRIEDCATGEIIDFTVASGFPNSAVTHINCSYVDCVTSGTEINEGTGISFIGCEWRECDAEALIGALDASATTRTVLFDGCVFTGNLTGIAADAYQIDLSSASADREYTNWTFSGCQFEDAVGRDNRGQHINIEDDMVLNLYGCYFNDPGPEDAIIKQLGAISDSCTLNTDIFVRQSWGVATTARVRSYNANGYGRHETIVTNLAAGTPTSQAIAGLVGDRIYPTGLLVSKGDELGWVCTQAGTFEAIDLGAHCTMVSGNSTFTVDTAYFDNLKIGDVLNFASVTTWDTAPFPVVVDISVNGTTATVAVDQACGSSHTNTAAAASDPIWSPLGMIPIHETVTVTVGGILGGVIGTGNETVTGAALGDLVVVGIDWTGVTVDPRDFLIDVKVNGADQIGWTVLNMSGSAVTTELDGFDWNFTVWKLGTEYN